MVKDGNIPDQIGKGQDLASRSVRFPIWINGFSYMEMLNCPPRVVRNQAESMGLVRSCIGTAQSSETGAFGMIS